MRGLLCALITVLATASAAADPSPPPNAGFIYGTVTERSGDAHMGFIRWEDEEAFWDDLFHSRQVDVPWDELVDMEELQKERRNAFFRNHNLIDRIAYSLENRDDDAELSRLFICRFGDLAAITIDGDGSVAVEHSDGTRQAVHGYSNDVTSDLLVYGTADKPVKLEWDDLAEIRFTQAPAAAVPYATRLYGRVTSQRGDFTGFIQWDQSECTSIDILDSDQEDLPMGEIASIRRDPRAGSTVTLRDGRILALDGTNDVGNGHRGVVIETADQGRLNIPWQRFTEVVFSAPPGSGAGREAYAARTELSGTVTDRDGAVHVGRLVYDLDEAWTSDIFNGQERDVKRDLPFGLIARVTPDAEQKCEVVLRDGRRLELSDDQDTGRDHAGVLVYPVGAVQPAYLPWSRVREIRFGP